jgi:hypothetical protein
MHGGTLAGSVKVSPATTKRERSPPCLRSIAAPRIA